MLGRFSHLLVICLSVLAFSSNGLAQDNPPSPDMIKRMQEFQKRQKDRMGDQMMLQQFNMITQNKTLLDDLEIVDKQRKEIESVMREYQQVQQEFMAANVKRQHEIQQRLADGDRQKAMQISMEFQEEQFKQIRTQLDKLEESLLPHQMNRLKQISRQQMAKLRTEYTGFLGLPLAMADELDLSTTEKKKLLAATKEADKQLREELEKLNAQKMKKILDALPREKREMYKELVGNLYDSDQAMQKIRASMYRRSRGEQGEKQEKND